MSFTKDFIRVCDHSGCAASYDASNMMVGSLEPGWRQFSARGEHWCPDHRTITPVVMAHARLETRYGANFQNVLRELDPWPVETLRDWLMCAPTVSAVWRQMIEQVLRRLEMPQGGTTP